MMISITDRSRVERPWGDEPSALPHCLLLCGPVRPQNGDTAVVALGLLTLASNQRGRKILPYHLQLGNLTESCFI